MLTARPRKARSLPEESESEPASCPSSRPSLVVGVEGLAWKEQLLSMSPALVWDTKLVRQILSRVSFLTNSERDWAGIRSPSVMSKLS